MYEWFIVYYLTSVGSTCFRCLSTCKDTYSRPAAAEYSTVVVTDLYPEAKLLTFKIKAFKNATLIKGSTEVTLCYQKSCFLFNFTIILRLFYIGVNLFKLCD